jgi:molybdate transport system substrate-binding protein
VNVVSREKDVKGVLGKVALGEADAGFVYRTDARAADSSVRTIELPRAVQPPIEFQAVVITGTEHERAAERLIARLLSGEGQRMLADAGFLPAKRD